MRTIKFRAQCEDKGVWRYGYLLHDTNGRPVISKFDNDMFVNTYGCIKGTEGQFTGLLDNNGREIYEGDVLRWRCSKSGSKKEQIYTVTIEWPKSGHGYSLTIHDKGEKWATQKSYWNSSEREVIGNIHENPELL